MIKIIHKKAKIFIIIQNRMIQTDKGQPRDRRKFLRVKAHHFRNKSLNAATHSSLSVGIWDVFYYLMESIFSKMIAYSCL